jgi:hypothetical protein
VINNSLLKCVRSFGKSKEKIVNIEGDSFHNKVMDVVKVVAEQKNKKAPPSLLGSKMVNPNPREKPFDTFISKAMALQW